MPTTPTFRILVDHDRCEGNAKCVQLAPAVFRTDEEDRLEVLQPEPGPEHRAAVEAAVARCPRQALMLEEV